MKRLVVFCEGQGDEEGALLLTKQVLVPLNPWSHLILDEAPFRCGEVASLFKNNFDKWEKLIIAATKRKSFGGILAILDGDADNVGKEKFCARIHAAKLGAAARKLGAGATFSVAVVFARQEFESWLIAGIESLAGRLLPPDNRPGIEASAKLPPGDLEIAPRGAKEWLSSVMHDGYAPTRDQGTLTRLVSLDSIRAKQLRSFARWESAVNQLLQAFQGGTSIVTPQ